MSKGKGATDKRAYFQNQHQQSSHQKIPTPPNMAMRQLAPPKRAVSRLLPIAAVLTAVVALAVGDGLWNTQLALAQDQTAAVPSVPSVGAQTSSLPESQQANPAAAAPAPVTHTRVSSRSARDDQRSSDLSKYLHEHHLPFVDAIVFNDAAKRPTTVELSGQVRTEHGKEDAATKSSDFFNDGVRVRNHIEVNASLDSTAPASSSASVVPASAVAAAPAAPTDPCSGLCLKDEGHCNTACQTQAAGGATGGGFSVQAIMGQFGQSATQLKECNDQCVQTREHCTYQCQTASSEPPAEGADHGGPAPDASDHQAEGPDTPPE